MNWTITNMAFLENCLTSVLENIHFGALACCAIQVRSSAGLLNAADDLQHSRNSIVEESREVEFLIRRKGGIIIRDQQRSDPGDAQFGHQLWLFAASLDECAQKLGCDTLFNSGNPLKLSDSRVITVTRAVLCECSKIASAGASSTIPLSSAIVSEASPSDAKNDDVTIFRLKRLFYEAVHGLISFRLAQTEELVPLQSGKLGGPVHGLSELSYVPLQPDVESFVLLQVRIFLHASGRLSISHTCICDGDTQHGDWLSRLFTSGLFRNVFVLLPGTVLGTPLKNGHPQTQQTSVNPRDPIQSSKSNDVVYWRTLVSKWLPYKGIHLSNLDRDESWERIELIKARSQADKLQYGPTSILDWPKALCFAITSKGMESLMGLSALKPKGEHSVADAFAKEEGISLVDFAMTFAQNKSTLEASSTHENPTQGLENLSADENDDPMELDAAWTIHNRSQRVDNQNPNPEIAGIYPTPPDANSTHITPASTSTTAMDNNTLSGGTDSDVVGKFAASHQDDPAGATSNADRPPSAHGDTPVRGNSVTDFMFDAGDEEFLNQGHVTDADFNFFDDADEILVSNIATGANNVELDGSPIAIDENAMYTAYGSSEDLPNEDLREAEHYAAVAPAESCSAQETPELSLSETHAPSARMLDSPVHGRPTSSDIFKSLETSDQKYRVSGRFFTKTTNTHSGSDTSVATRLQDRNRSIELPLSPNKQLNSIPRLDTIREHNPSDSTSSGDDDSDDTVSVKTAYIRSRRSGPFDGAMPKNDATKQLGQGSRGFGGNTPSEVIPVSIYDATFVNSAETVLSVMIDTHLGAIAPSHLNSLRYEGVNGIVVNRVYPLRVDEFMTVAQLVTEQLCTFPVQMAERIRAYNMRSVNSRSLISSHFIDTFSKIFVEADLQRVDDVLAQRSYMDERGESPLCAIAPPEITLRRNDVPFAMLPSALPFWETIGLEPAHGRKDVIAFCVFPSPIVSNGQAGMFLHCMRQAYESHKFGSHFLGGSTGSEDAGLLPVPVMEDDHASFDASKLQKVFSSIGLQSSKTAEKHPVVVIYVIDLLGFASFQKICGCFLKFLSSPRHLGIYKNRLRFILQIMPASGRWFSGDLSIYEPEVSVRIATGIYDRISSTAPTHDIYGFLRTRSVELIEEIPSRIPFRLAENAPRYLMVERAVAHVAYCKSVDGLWVTAAWTDNHGKRDGIRSYCLNGGREFTDVINEIWATTIGFTKVLKTSWQVHIVKVGTMDTDELLAWKAIKDAISTDAPFSIRLVFLAVDPTPTVCVLPDMATTGTSSLPTSTHATPQATTYPSSYATPPMSTPPQFPINSPAAVVSTPTAEGAGASADTDPNSRLIDITDETWGVIAKESRNPFTMECALSCNALTGFLIKRGGAGELDEARLMEVTLIGSLDDVDANLRQRANADDASDKSHILMDTLKMFRGLALLAKIRGATEELKGILPWHIAMAASTADRLSHEMPLAAIQEPKEPS